MRVATTQGDPVRRLIALSGPICAGKSHFAEALSAAVHTHKVSTRQFLVKQGAENTRAALQEAGVRLDKETGGAWVVEVAREALVQCPADSILLLDCVRIKVQLDALRAEFGDRLFHVHLTAQVEALEERYLQRNHEVAEFATFAEARENPTEAAVPSLAKVANIILDTEFTSSSELAAVALQLARISPVKVARPLVDVFVGAQYGSEGKGNICSALARNYEVLMRIGGPNAGHMAPEPRYKYVQLPSGTGANPEAKILIGAGSTIWLPQLMLEMLDHKVTPERLSIDPQAIIIDDEDRRLEAGALTSIASTKQGVGLASARKILNRGEEAIFGAPVRLARCVEQLDPFVRDTRVELEKAFEAGHRVMLEGTQGTALSIHHGHYPFVTSRETSASGCLSDAGVAPLRIRKVVMVTRTYPIRVGGTSGPMGAEIDFSDIAERSQIPVDELRKTEKGTISRTPRRVAEFDWVQFRRAVMINRPTDIALTFADYHDINNRNAQSFDGLGAKTQAFIGELEHMSGAKVTLVSTKFAADGVLRRGDW